MGRAELIASLYREGEQKAREIWRQAEAEATRLEADGERTLKQKQTEAESFQARLIANEQRPVLRAGERKARSIQAKAKEELARELYRLARACLDQAPEKDDQLFAALVAELPSLRWQRVRVNPADRIRAERYFPRTELIPDPEIFGGMEVIDESGRIRVDNSLQKRLERAWPEILPGLLDAVLQKEGLR